MRITGGSLKGRQLKVRDVGRGTDTRPTTEMVRQAIFSALESLVSLDGVTVADLYAGTGSFGLEAISRGASKALFVELSRGRVEELRANAEVLGISGQVTIVQSAVERVLENPGVALNLAPLGVVFADPPYTAHPGPALLERISASPLVRAGTWVIVGADKRTDWGRLPESVEKSLATVQERKYGDSVIRIYEKIA